MTVQEGHTPVHLKEGKAIPYQPNDSGASTTAEMLTQNIHFLAFRDSNNYAEGNLLIDDGISPMGTDNYAFWKFRLAQNTVTFQLEGGVMDPKIPKSVGTQSIESIKILAADDLAGVDFACMISSDLSAEQIMPVYNKDFKTLELRPHDGSSIPISKITMVKFGDSTKETNFCNMTTSFKYTAKAPTVATDKKSMTVELTNEVTKTNTVFATFTLLDNEFGDIKVELTPDQKMVTYTDGLVDESGFKYTSGKATIETFVKVNQDPFYYTIMNAAGEQVYQSDPVMFMKSGTKFVMSTSHIHTYSIHDYPIFGMGQRDGPVKLPSSSGATYSFWNAKGEKKMSGYQPFYMFQNHDQSFVGVFDLSTYAADYLVDNNRADGEALITHILTGGSITKYIFLGGEAATNSPISVI